MQMVKRKTTIIPVLLALLIAASGAAFYFYWQANVSKEDATLAAPPEVAAIIAKVGKLIALPLGEIPTVATVANPDKLKDQPFFAQAKEGDKVLVYTIARKVYLYDPVNNILVNVAPLSIETTATATP